MEHDTKSASPPHAIWSMIQAYADAMNLLGHVTGLPNASDAWRRQVESVVTERRGQLKRFLGIEEG